jgi:hypothetical protein
MRCIATIVAALLISLAWNNWTGAEDNLAAQAAALNVIRETANDICYTVQLKGQTEGTQLSGEIQAKVTGVIAKVADLGVKGAGKLKNQEYAGVLQEELATTIRHSADCKKDVFDKLVEKMLPSSTVRSSDRTPPFEGNHREVVGQPQPNIVVLPTRPIGSAKEPNDRIYDATPILFGSTIVGKLTKGDRIDWYVFKTPENASEKAVVVFRWIGGGYFQSTVQARIYDADEKQLGFLNICCRTGGSVRVDVEKNATYYIEIQGDSNEELPLLDYELSVRNTSTETAR